MRKIKYLFSAIVVVLMCCMAAMANEAASFGEYLAYSAQMVSDSHGGVMTASLDNTEDSIYSCKRLLAEFYNAAYLPDVIEAVDYVLYDNLGVFAFATEVQTEAAYNVLSNLDDVKGVLIDRVITMNTSVGEVASASVEDITALLEKQNWGISAVKADQFKSYVETQNPGEVVVGIIDSGLNMEHPYFKDSSRVLDGVNLVNSLAITDDTGHGTHVSGIVMASTSDNVKIKMYKIFDGTSSNLLLLYNALKKAVADKVDVINLSLAADCTDLLHSVVDEAYQAGIIIAAAAGNGGEDYIADPIDNICPAHYSEHLITVGAIDSSLNVAAYSNYGAGVDICAPGTGIYSTVYSGYTSLSGTSMSAPFVAAYAAMMRSLNSSITYEEFCTVLTENAYTPVGWDTEKNGVGILDMTYVTILIENIHTHKARFIRDDELDEISFVLQLENKTADPFNVLMHFAFLNDKGVQIGSGIESATIKSTKKPTLTVPIYDIPDGTATIKGYVWTAGMEPVSMASDYIMPVEY